MVSLVASRNACVCVCVCVELVPAAHICDSAVHFFGEAFFAAFFFVLFLAFFTAFGLVTFLVAFFDALGMVRERVWFLPTMLGRCLLRNCVHA